MEIILYLLPNILQSYGPIYISITEHYLIESILDRDSNWIGYTKLGSKNKGIEDSIKIII
jgi:hypothetical protein